MSSCKRVNTTIRIGSIQSNSSEQRANWKSAGSASWSLVRTCSEQSTEEGLWWTCFMGLKMQKCEDASRDNFQRNEIFEYIVLFSMILRLQHGCIKKKWIPDSKMALRSFLWQLLSGAWSQLPAVQKIAWMSRDFRWPGWLISIWLLVHLNVDKMIESCSSARLFKCYWAEWIKYSMDGSNLRPFL